MPSARKYTSNQPSMSRQSRGRAYAAINILWQQMRPDLRFEDKDVIRDERLSWIGDFLGLEKLDSTTKLSDKQIGMLLEEMKRLTGQASKTPENNTKFGKSQNINNSENAQPDGAEIIHLAGEEQIYTINKLVGSIGWTEDGFREFLFQKFRRRSPRMLTFKKANSLMMILLNIAADKHLRAQGKTKISRQMTAEYIPVLKRKLQIGD
ncbi:MAG: hypothetical protein M3Q99_16855 [Acidobacteriota bacterium]|nr:hypothetical protein [Acidobacteriota bacterium]